MKSVVIVCLILAMTMARGASAEFGEKGTKVVHGDFRFQVAKIIEKSPDGESESGTSVGLTALGSYFVADRVSVGARIGLAYESGEDVTTTAVAFGGVVGYAMPIGERVYLWPIVGLTYGWADVEFGSISAMQKAVLVHGFAPVYVEPSEHFLVGIGPAFDTQVTSTSSVDGESEDGDKRTSFGVLGSLAGWF